VRSLAGALAAAALIAAAPAADGGTRFSVERGISAAMESAANFLEHSSYANVQEGPESLYAEGDAGRQTVAVRFTSSADGRRTGVEVVYRRRPSPLYPAPDDARIERSLARSLEEAILTARNGSEGAAPGSRDLAPIPEGPRRPLDAAIVIGVPEYRDLPPVATAKRDVRAFRAIVEKALGVDAANVLTLDENVTAADMERAVEKWLPAHASAGSQVYFYFSGHAVRRKDGEAVLLGWAADPLDPGSGGLPISKLSRLLHALPRSEHVLFLDACTANGLNPATLTALNPRSSAVFAATGSSRPALSDGERGHGFFSERVFSGLRGEARGADGRVTSGSLRRYLARTVPEDSGARQAPYFFGADDLVLFSTDAARAPQR